MAECPECATLKAELYEAKTFTTCDECNNRVPYEEPLRLCDTCYATEHAEEEAVKVARDNAEARAESAAVALRALQPYLKHTLDCPQAYDEKWIGVLHREQHLDDDAMEDCHFAACRAWCVSVNPPCSCGLSILLSRGDAT